MAEREVLREVTAAQVRDGYLEHYSGIAVRRRYDVVRRLPGGGAVVRVRERTAAVIRGIGLVNG